MHIGSPDKNFWSNKNVVVTGGCGFIGSALIEKLNHIGVKSILSVDDYSSGARDNEILGVNYLECHTAHITEDVLQHSDLVFHLGEYSRVEASFRDLDAILQSNVKGTSNIFALWKKLNFKLIYAGSSTKFGDGGLGRHQSPYALSKSHNTETVKSFIDWFGLKGAITYFYNVYGDGEISSGNFATVVAIFIDKFRKGEPLPVVKPGVQRRNFTHIDDIVDGLLLVGQYGHGDEYGIGADESYSIEDLAKLISENIIYLDERPGNRLDARVVTSKLRALGWQPKHSLAKYVREQCKKR
ncbi:NAD-dependent epimerase/dehydratase family protein [Roseobacter sp. HKCCA0882]|uniref:NAD-dependent epimerase/dehydratase family protein n=1 Tax=Roseobacter sp. HKCCA0882 TaxID=3120337 RepID=UPI0030EF538B